MTSEDSEGPGTASTPEGQATNIKEPEPVHSVDGSADQEPVLRRRREPRDVQVRRSELDARKTEVRSLIERRRRVRLLYGLGGLVLVLVSAGLLAARSLFNAESQFVLLVAGVLAVYGLLMLVLAAVSTRRLPELELFDIDQELDLLGFYNANQEQRAERLFKLHQGELKKYYDITRSQSVLIFYVGLASIVMGFLIIVGAYYAITVGLGNAQLSDKIVVGALAAVGSTLSNFIAAVYLHMYSGTVGSLTEFHSRLVGTHHLHYAYFLAAKLQDSALRESTVAEMALIAAHGALSPATVKPLVVAESHATD